MSRWISNTLGISLTAVVCLFGYGGVLLFPHIIAAVDATRDVAQQGVIAGTTFNHPKWGTLYEVDQTLKNIRLTVDAANKVAIHEEHQLSTIDGYASHLDREVSDLAGSSGRTLDAIATTAQGATDTLSEAQTDLATARTSLVAIPPLMEAYTRSGEDLDTLLRSQAISGTLENVDALTGNLNGIAADGRKVTDKLTTDFLAPQPWWKKIGRFASDGFDYGALAARHIP